VTLLPYCIFLSSVTFSTSPGKISETIQMKIVHKALVGLYVCLLFSGDTDRCDGMPCMYYDSVIVNGEYHSVGATYPAGHLPHGWSSNVGFQFQIDIGDVGSPVTVEEFVDLAGFKAM